MESEKENVIDTMGNLNLRRTRCVRVSMMWYQWPDRIVSARAEIWRGRAESRWAGGIFTDGC